MTEKKNQNANRKALIVAAAITCFIEKGYNQSGVRDIAGKAGISLGNLYNHFSGKDAVLAEIAAMESCELRVFEDMVSDHQDPMAALMRFAEAYLAYAGRPENALLGLEIIGEAVRNPEIAAAFSSNRARLLSSVAALLAAGVEAGQMRKFPSQPEAVRLILDAIEGQGLRQAMGSLDAAADAKSSLITFLRMAVSA